MKNIYTKNLKGMSYSKGVPLPRTFINNKVIRDNFRRQKFAETELTQTALRFISRNPKLPITARLEAQIQLAKMPTFTRFTHIKNRCIASGTARAVFGKFRLGRFQFREYALRGELPGVHKGSW